MDSIEKVSQSSAQVRKPLSLRLPARDIEAVEDFARSNRMSKTDAFLHFLHKGMDAESQQDDLSGIRQQLMQITSLLERNALGSTEQEIREAV
ncbi:MAG: hypothetical protein RR672_13600, partial [Raoultibacter sp.]